MIRAAKRAANAALPSEVSSSVRIVPFFHPELFVLADRDVGKVLTPYCSSVVQLDQKENKSTASAQLSTESSDGTLLCTLALKDAKKKPCLRHQSHYMLEHDKYVRALSIAVTTLQHKLCILTIYSSHDAHGSGCITHYDPEGFTPSVKGVTYQACVKTRYCGCLYSSLLRIWKWVGHKVYKSPYGE